MAKVNIGTLEDEKGDVITGNEKMAEALNRYFMSVFTVEDTNNMPKLMTGRLWQVRTKKLSLSRKR